MPNDTSRLNAFTLERWFFALSLVVFRCGSLMDLPYTSQTLGRACVSAFFIMSGYLTLRSYLRHPGWRPFFARRARRLVPPYAVAIMLCVAVGACFTTLSLADFFGQPATWRYLVSNLLFLNFLQPTLPGAFAGNPLPYIDPALWTMKIEIGFYLLVPALVLLVRRLGMRRVLVGGYLLAVLWFVGCHELYLRTGSPAFSFLERQLPGQMMYFFAGMMMLPCKDGLVRRRAVALPLSLVLWAVCSQIYVLRVLEPIFLSAFLVTLAYAFPRLNQLSAKAPNYTYGVYLFHCPLIQCAVALGLVQSLGVAPVYCMVVAMALALAVVVRRAMKHVKFLQG